MTASAPNSAARSRVISSITAAGCAGSEVYLRMATSRRLLVERGDVGEGAADVDPDAQRHEAGLRAQRAVAAASTLRSVVKATP